MNDPGVGRMLFYYRTDLETADRIMRDGFPTDLGFSCLLSLEVSDALRGTASLCIALPVQAATKVLGGLSQHLLGALREYVVPGALLATGYVSRVGDHVGGYAPA
jgi:hypothetical protein